MRLIDTCTGELKEYTASNIPQYVALSHRWTDDEITFKDYTKGRRKDSAGYRKIERLRDIAAARGAEHCWIDTVCIDKRSSSELSEAINSMYKWYQNALACYVYLSDVHNDDGEMLYLQIRSSVWFTRGWTLQELLAPSIVKFFTSTWIEIGFCGIMTDYYHSVANAANTVPDVNLTQLISQITSIPMKVLEYPSHTRHSTSVAERMKWLRKRKTTREEDLAYCALGIFDVNMPLLYGEGNRAWDRLLAEIIRTTHDESIFIATAATSLSKPFSCVPLLPPSPDSYITPGERAQRLASNIFPRPPYSLTNQGLELRLKAETAHTMTLTVRSPPGDAAQRRLFLVPLNCLAALKKTYFFLVLLEQSCGHYDRVLVPRTTIPQLESGSRRVLAREETIYVHTTAEMQLRCYNNSAEASRDDVAVHHSYTTYLDVELDVIMGEDESVSESSSLLSVD